MWLHEWKICSFLAIRELFHGVDFSNRFYLQRAWTSVAIVSMWFLGRHQVYRRGSVTLRVISAVMSAFLIESTIISSRWRFNFSNLTVSMAEAGVQITVGSIKRLIKYVVEGPGWLLMDLLGSYWLGVRWGWVTPVEVVISEWRSPLSPTFQISFQHQLLW